jgi:hypothetical protein
MTPIPFVGATPNGISIASAAGIGIRRDLGFRV